MGTGPRCTHACIQIGGSTQKRTARKWILAKILFPFYLFSFQPLEASRDLLEQCPSPAQPFSARRSASVHVVLLTPGRLNTLRNWTFNSGLVCTLLPHLGVAHPRMGDSSPGQGTEFFFFPQGRWVFNCPWALEEPCQGNHLYSVLRVLSVTSFEVSTARRQSLGRVRFLKNLYFNSGPSRRVSGTRGLFSTGNIQYRLEQKKTKA